MKWPKATQGLLFNLGEWEYVFVCSLWGDGGGTTMGQGSPPAINHFPSLKSQGCGYWGCFETGIKKKMSFSDYLFL